MPANPSDIFVILVFILFGALVMGIIIWGIAEVAVEMFRRRKGTGIIWGGTDGIGYDMAIHFAPLDKTRVRIIEGWSHCRFCDRMVPQNAEFCRHCGGNLVGRIRTTCPNCGVPIPGDTAFCEHCGEGVKDKQE